MQFTRFFVFYNWSTKKTEPTVFQNRTQTETEPNPRFFSKPNRTKLEKSIPHIPNFVCVNYIL